MKKLIILFVIRFQQACYLDITFAILYLSQIITSLLTRSSHRPSFVQIQGAKFEVVFPYVKQGRVRRTAASSGEAPLKEPQRSSCVSPALPLSDFREQRIKTKSNQNSLKHRVVFNVKKYSPKVIALCCLQYCLFFIREKCGLETGLHKCSIVIVSRWLFLNGVLESLVYAGQ